VRIHQRVLARLARLRSGSLGDWKALGGGVFELRIDYGPGYRLYFGRDGSKIVILLAGGTKETQSRDIKRAKENGYDYKEFKTAKDC
jgi:putative addiction module killer protein